MVCIILEGLSLYLVIIMIILLLIVSLFSIVWAVLSNKRIFSLKTLLYRERKNVRCLIRKNFVLQLRNGEIDIDDK